MGQYRLLPNEWVNTDCGEFIVDYTIAEKSSMKIYLKHWEDEEFGSKFELQSPYTLIAAKIAQVPETQIKFERLDELTIIHDSPNTQLLFQKLDSFTILPKSKTYSQISKSR